MNKLILSFAIVFFISIAASAQLYLKNETSEPVLVASAIYVKTAKYEYWITRGWYKVEPNSTKQIAASLGDVQSVYYYAKSTISKKEYSGDTQFLVSNVAFEIKNADMEYVKKEHTEYYWVKFRKEFGSDNYLKTKRTIILKY